MKRALAAVPAALLMLALAGCTGTATGSTGHHSDVAGTEASGHSIEAGQDLGNGRPVVSYDGLMVRRRVVIAVHSGAEADLGGIRTKLAAGAAAQSMHLDPIPPTVLEPAMLQHTMPELIVALPPDSTLDNAQAVADEATANGAEALGAEHFHVLQVLVHDLQFAIRTADPAHLSAEVDREGILADYLGNYQTASGVGELSFSYTGPLLGDDVVESVRSAIARPEHTTAEAITVSPRSSEGSGVDMETEPPWEPEVLDETDSHTH